MTCLRDMGNPQAVKPLSALLEQGGPEESKAWAVRVLSEIGGEEVIAFLDQYAAEHANTDIGTYAREQVDRLVQAAAAPE
ncbi:MAG TPA: hypothetical protein HPP83_10655 [Candidatus Hydrogenedentes bacterium]|nr:hypothetical protein [Candidatus Hydrogenedentota bacterium]